MTVPSWQRPTVLSWERPTALSWERPTVPWRIALPTMGAAILVGAAAAIDPLLAGALPIVVALALATFYLPGVVFAAYLWIPPFYKAALQPYAPVDLTVLLAIASAAQFAIYIVTPGRTITAKPLLLWAGLALLVLAGSLWAADPAFGRDQAVGWLLLVTVPLLAVFRVASDERYVREFVWASFAAGFVIVLLGLINPSAAALLGTNPLGIARAALFVPIVAYRSRAAIVLVPLALFMSFATGERGPLLALLATTAIVVGVRMFRERRVPKGALVAAAAGGVGFVVAMTVGLVPSAALDRFSLLFDGGGNTTAIRLTLFAQAADLFVQQPFLGVGTAGFTVYALPLLPTATASGVALYPHNLVVQFAAEFGIIGLFALGMFLWNVARAHWPDTWAWRSVAILALFTLACAQTSGGIYDNRGLWGLLLLLLAVPVSGSRGTFRRRVPPRPVAAASGPTAPRR